MRVLLVANTLPPDDISGVGEQVLQLAAGLEELGHEVRVLGRQSHGLASKKLVFPLTVVPGLLRELASFRPAVVQHVCDVAVVVPCNRPSSKLPGILGADKNKQDIVA